MLLECLENNPQMYDRYSMYVFRERRNVSVLATQTTQVSLMTSLFTFCLFIFYAPNFQ